MRPLLFLLLAAPAFAHPAPPVVRNWTAAVLPSREPPVAEPFIDPLWFEVGPFGQHLPMLREHVDHAWARWHYLHDRQCMEYDRPEWAAETRRQYRVWWAWMYLAHAIDPYNELNGRRASVAALRELIGDEAFELGVMPEPVVGMGER